LTIVHVFKHCELNENDLDSSGHVPLSELKKFSYLGMKLRSNSDTKDYKNLKKNGEKQLNLKNNFCDFGQNRENISTSNGCSIAGTHDAFRFFSFKTFTYYR
jgi:hypothetical protein